MNATIAPRGPASGHSGSKSLLRVLLGTAAILLIPFVAMQVTDEVNWTAFDFVAAAVLLSVAGFALELAAAKLRTGKSRVLAGLVIGMLFLLVWAEMAVGIVGSPIAGS